MCIYQIFFVPLRVVRCIVPESVARLLVANARAPWKDEYLRNIEKAITCYEAGYYYWKEAQLWAEKANTKKFNFLFITDLQNWEDERKRIKTGELNYKQILDRELTRLKKVRDEFIAMDSKNY